MIKKPLCFILMSFGKKVSGSSLIDFDDIYRSIIKPAVIAAGLEPVRADEEMTDGIIHKPMFERLILCEYAVADLTGANANVFYELGVRHAIIPYSTILLFADSTRLPFDVSFLRALGYAIDANGKAINAETVSEALTKKLLQSKENKLNDSPLFQLLDNYPNIAHEKTDVFRDLVEYSKSLKKKLREIRDGGATLPEKLSQLKQFEKELDDLDDIETGVIIDLFLSYRAVKGFAEMITLIEKMPAPLKATVMVREQYGFALNRLGKRHEAEEILTVLIKERGASSETYALLGRVYKDQWEEACSANNVLLAKGFLRRAIDAYTKGFEADWRDAYPGINACTLMFIEDPDREDLKKLLPVVKFAVSQKIEKQGGDYWDHATLFELDILEKDFVGAEKKLENAASLIREVWEPETTLKNLRMIRKVREAEGDNVEGMIKFEKDLEKLVTA
ncbi:MAG: TRAFs-binding domain-containing protein [Bacteroidota bacterium]